VALHGCGLDRAPEPLDDTSAALETLDIVISEVAWMGTNYSTSDEWLELYNPGSAAVDLNGWTITAQDGSPAIVLSGVIPAGGYFLLERTDDTTVPGVAADQIYSGALENGGEGLELRSGDGVLIDATALTWAAGDNTTKATMERIDAGLPGTDPQSWASGSAVYEGGLGTPGNGSLGGGGGACGDGVCNNSETCATCAGDCGACGSEQIAVLVQFAHNQGGKPEPTCDRPMCQKLLGLIQGATTSIDFAIYGVRAQQHIVDALVAAQQRGVRVRGLVDGEDAACTRFTYPDTRNLIDSLAPGTVVCDTGSGYSYIMHNKFFVFDKDTVWTGSTNVSDTEVGGEYNSNVVATIASTRLADIYTTEFEEMYAGACHNNKTDNTVHVLDADTWSDGTTVVKSYFSPTDNARDNAIIPLINAATSTLDVAMFFLTSQEIASALLAAHERGVTVRVVIDAGGGSNAYSKTPDLCAAGIDVIQEDWGGKSHSKWAVADSTVSGAGAVVFGSMNWTAAGNNANDENTLYIRNDTVAAQFQQEFDRQWSALAHIPTCSRVSAEGADASTCSSPYNCTAPDTCTSGSCCDGSDNDYDGRTDLDDEACGCTDGVDNDGDGYIDAEDFECWTVLGCGFENTAAACNDGIDNDCDGYVDGNDYDCSGLTATEDDATTCSDGADNDSDGYTDGDDQGCAGVMGLTNSGPGGDGQSSEAPNGYGLVTCADGVNNDGGSPKLDCNDSDCRNVASCTGGGGGGGGPRGNGPKGDN
jgi:phosphatidylserine/phosphatidylglycerophosphate/cardiolipin synthase-like enzyme